MNWLESYLKEVDRYDHLISQITTRESVVSNVEKIKLLSKKLVLIGEIAGEYSRQYKVVYAARKKAYNEEYLAASRHRAPTAELAVAELREIEASAYGNMKKYQNKFESTREEINAIKYSVKLSIEDGSSRQGA
jgi:soluble cytochrome b562